MVFLFELQFSESKENNISTFQFCAQGDMNNKNT